MTPVFPFRVLSFNQGGKASKRALCCRYNACSLSRPQGAVTRVVNDPEQQRSHTFEIHS